MHTSDKDDRRPWLGHKYVWMYMHAEGRNTIFIDIVMGTKYIIMRSNINPCQ
jgi:hypothetical protein